MRLESIEIMDFGPYIGTQQFDFSPLSGVELMWGENGQGKTSFLNAARWALFGTVLGRGSTIDPSLIGHRHPDEPETVKPFKVALIFTHGGHRYKLTRAYRQEKGPDGLPLFQARPSLVKDGDVLGPEDRDRELAKLLPEQIARFFLFDAELLQEYEQLLTAGSEAGEKLKAAIERILGLPVLTQARDDVASHLASARKAQAKAAQRDKETVNLGNELQLKSDEAENLRNNVRELVDHADELQNDVNELEKDLTANNRYKGLLATRDEKRKEVERLQERYEQKADELEDAITDTWRAVLTPALSRELVSVEQAIEGVEDRLEAVHAHRQVATAAASGTCPTCGEQLQDGVIRRLRERGPAEDPENVKRDLVMLRTRRTTLRMQSDGTRIIQLEKEVNQAKVDLSDAQGRLGELQAWIDQAPPGTEQAISSLVGALQQKTVLLANTRTRLRDSREDLQRKEQAVISYSERLRKMGTASTGAEDRKVKVLVELQSLLNAAVTEFRDRLRDSIEEEATKVFKALSAEPDYDRLRINDSYGLAILYANGSEVLNRSSGYEHVVALSLIAALQRCSPMSGPIITDSPFGRLDGTHKKHVLQALPEITDQVMLLVHGEELDRQNAINELGTRLVGEHHLRRVAAHQTAIERGAQP